jgi:hypothetical protein
MVHRAGRYLFREIKYKSNRNSIGASMKTTDKTVWFMYDILDDIPSQTDNRDIAIDARDVRKLEVYEEHTSSTQLDNGTTVMTVITQLF